ncbi:hypothetical protein [Endothiovibrio diazotrophicus]
MRKLVIAASLLALFSNASLALAAEQADYEAQCRKWAQEDEVPADQLQEYLARCIEDAKASAAEDAKAAQTPAE